MALREPTRWDAARELHLWNWQATAGGGVLFLSGIGVLLLGPAEFARRLAVLALLGLVVLGLWWAAEIVGRAKDPGKRQWRLGLGAVALMIFAGLISRTEGSRVGWLLGLGGLFLSTTVTTWWAWDRLLRPLSSGQRVTRSKYHANRNDGTASIWDVWQRASAWTMRRKAGVARPSLAALTGRQLRRVNPSEFSVLVATTGWEIGPAGREAAVYSSVEEVTMRAGGPRIGKTQSLANHILDAPGPVVCTSTRADMLEITGQQRAEVGVVHVFNPTGLGNIPSTVRWTPLAGCEDYATAQRRAASMIQKREGDAQMWAEQATRIFAILLHAAARKGHRLQKVADWTADPGQSSRDEIIEALKGAPNVLALLAEVRQFTGTADRTRTSITTSIMPALQWLAAPGCAQVGDAPIGEADLFDLQRWVESRDTLYLIGSPDGIAVSPLISALTAELAHQLRMVAGMKPAGRLDPPAAVVLDEMTLACPQIPIDKWSADMGGRGVTIHISIQSFAQLRQIWGADATDALLNNVGTLLIFGGLKADRDLQIISSLSGQRLEQVDEDDRRYVVVFDGANISDLGEGEVLLFCKGIRPVLGFAPQVWQRKQPKPARTASSRAALRAWFPRPAGA